VPVAPMAAEALAPPPQDAGEPVPVVEALEEKASPGQEWSLERLRGEWLGVIEKVQSSSLNLATSARDAELASFAQGLLTLRVANAYQRKVLDDAAERARLEQALSDLCGSAVKVQITYAEAPKKKAASGKPSADEVEQLLKQSPELRKVQELFGAEIVEIRND
jgi:hypothetical protein